MKMMKAYVRTSANDMHVEMRDVPVPTLADDEVLVSIEAFGVGIHDRYFIPEDARFPYVIGIEGAGRIVELGEEGTDFAVGDRVVFTSSMNPTGGTWAEFAAVKREALMAMPETMKSETAAVIPVAGGTALQGLMNLDMQPNESLFIAGASGAVGSFAIQLATQMGLRVSSSASASNLHYMETLGAQKAVDYNDAAWPDAIRAWAGGGVDAALAIQPDTEISAKKVVRDGGRVIMVSGYGKQVQSERGIKISQLTHNDSTRPHLERLLISVAEGTIRAVIEAEYPFANALDALEKSETRHARGKLVVKVEH